MRIAFFEIHDWEKEILKKEFKSHDLEFYSKPLSENNLNEVKDCDIISVFIYSKITPQIIKRLPNLKLIITRSMGTDHLDLKACKNHKVLVCNTPHYGDNSVAEHTFALILSISRNIHKAYLRTMKKNYSIEGLKGFDLKGKTLGVLGVGRIGTNVIKIARGFGMNVLANDHHLDNKFAKQYSFKYTTLNDVLKNADILTLHVPYIPKNYHLIDMSAFKKMKKGAVLINTSRGPIIDTKAMLFALETKMLSAVGLDVLEGEELIKEEKEFLHDSKNINIQKMQQLAIDHELLENENVVFTPHIAFFSQEAVMRILEVTIETIKSFLKKKPINLV
ncbi:MAG: NAD(P)-dependent oxidoreductase [archaeon]|nr:NAD(P)-dependent oxidoreductase [archaeon]